MKLRKFNKTLAAGIRVNWNQNAYRDYQGGTYLYKDVAEMIIKFQMLLDKHAIGIGSRIAILGRNARNRVVKYLATVLNGQVVVPILPDFLMKIFRIFWNNSESVMLFVSKEYFPGIDARKLPNLKAVFSLQDFSLIYCTLDGLNEDVTLIQETFDSRFPNTLLLYENLPSR